MPMNEIVFLGLVGFVDGNSGFSTRSGTLKSNRSTSVSFVHCSHNAVRDTPSIFHRLVWWYLGKYDKYTYTKADRGNAGHEDSKKDFIATVVLLRFICLFRYRHVTIFLSSDKKVKRACGQIYGQYQEDWGGFPV
jgi:hypothetical protein